MDTTYFSTSEPASLQEVLLAREQRVARQGELLALLQRPLISFTLNTPGVYKIYPLAQALFLDGLEHITRQLKGQQITIFHREQRLERAGALGLFAVEGDAARVKRAMIAIEEYHPVGRLFDIDVIGLDGVPLSRQVFQKGERACLICGGPASHCGRNRTHSVQELSIHAARLMETYLLSQFSNQVASTAVRALLYEVSVTPKPGLVDRDHSGAHKDMDFFTFLDSGCTLFPYFSAMVERGYYFQGAMEDLLPTLRYDGLQAEYTMLQATGDVNTHKGAIFAMGLLCACLGFLKGAQEDAMTQSALLDCVARAAADTPKELQRTKEMATHGEHIFKKFGISGARAEAASGFVHVRDYGYPTLKHYLGQGWSLNHSALAALLAILAASDDTNMIHRSDLNTFRGIQQEIKEALHKDMSTEQLLALSGELDQQFIEQNLSPGGSADLLSVTLFLYFIRDIALEG